MPVRVLNYEPEYEVVPHAIVWRPLRYFTLTIREGIDDLDHFRAASFAIGNDIKFDLRVYCGHLNPEFTVTLYLPEEVTDRTKISEIIKTVINEMFIPLTAFAWRRGERFEYGELHRRKTDRLFEDEARLLVLKIAAQQTNRSATAKTIREEVQNYIELSPLDRIASKTRPREQMWHQIIRNVTSSHQHGKRGIFGMGWAEKKGDLLKVTDTGLAYLNSIGFISSVSAFKEE
jgi:hypothetical protein